MRGPTKQWEIAERGFAEGWYRIGTGEGSNPRSALQSWVEEKHTTVRPGFYGVRSPGEDEAAWQPFHLDASGVLHDRVNQTRDAHRAEDEPSVRCPKAGKEIPSPFPMGLGILILAAGGVGIANLLKRRH